VSTGYQLAMAIGLYVNYNIKQKDVNHKAPPKTIKKLSIWWLNG